MQLCLMCFSFLYQQTSSFHGSRGSRGNQTYIRPLMTQNSHEVISSPFHWLKQDTQDSPKSKGWEIYSAYEAMSECGCRKGTEWRKTMQCITTETQVTTALCFHFSILHFIFCSFQEFLLLSVGFLTICWASFPFLPPDCQSRTPCLGSFWAHILGSVKIIYGRFGIWCTTHIGEYSQYFIIKWDFI